MTGFVLLRRCQHPGCDAVLRVSQVEGLQVRVLHEWGGDRLEVDQGAEQPYPEEPRYCPEHGPSERPPAHAASSRPRGRKLSE